MTACVSLLKFMRAVLSTLLAGALAVSGVTIAGPAYASVWEAPEQTPEQLYEDGRKAYRLGDYDIAVEKWEQAYALSDNPLLLYNISLAYKGKFGMTTDIADLRKAKAVLDNFIKLANADPELEEDDAPQRLAEIEKLLKEEERRLDEEKDGGGIQPPVVPDDKPTGPDPGRKLRLAGIGTMAAGGVFLIVGGSLGLYYSVRGQRFSDELQDWVNRLGGDEDNPAPTEADCMEFLPAVELNLCPAQMAANAETARDNGREANVAAIVSFAVGGGLGAIALVTGAIVFTEGNRRTRKWEDRTAKHELRLLPSLGGFSISGRF